MWMTWMTWTTYPYIYPLSTNIPLLYMQKVIQVIRSSRR